MRLAHSLIFAGALFVAAPALSQDNAAAPANTVADNTVDANLVGTVPADTNTAAVPADQSALPPSAATPVDTGTAPAPEPRRGFPWGVLGVLGLAGLLGARKARS